MENTTNTMSHNSNTIDKIDRVDVYNDTMTLCKTKYSVPIIPSTRLNSIDTTLVPRYKSTKIHYLIQIQSMQQ